MRVSMLAAALAALSLGFGCAHRTGQTRDTTEQTEATVEFKTIKPLWRTWVPNEVGALDELTKRVKKWRTDKQPCQDIRGATPRDEPHLPYRSYKGILILEIHLADVCVITRERPLGSEAW